MEHGVPVRKHREDKVFVYLPVTGQGEPTLYKRYIYVDKTNWVEYCPICGKRLCSRFNNYCPNCGAPMTDEAVEMVMERLEKLKNEIG